MKENYKKIALSLSRGDVRALVTQAGSVGLTRFTQMYSPRGSIHRMIFAVSYKQIISLLSYAER